MKVAQASEAPPIARLLTSRWLWVVLAITSIIALSYSINDLFEYAGIDLRNRVVGARALIQSLDPYKIEWRSGMPLELADMFQRYPGVTRVTAAPPLLLLYMPFAELPYRTQQLIWWVLQWTALGITIVVFARSFRSEVDRKVFLLIAVVCFVGSWFWRLHVERGQYYIFSTMLLSLDLALLRDEGQRPKWLGIPSGIAVAIKPTNIVLFPMLWFLGERRAALVAAFASALVVAASLYPIGPQVWSSFLTAIQENAAEEMDPTFASKHYGQVQAVAPRLIEGLDFGKALSLGVDDSRIVPSNLTAIRKPWATYVSQLVVIGLFVVGPLTIWQLKRRGAASRDLLLLIITLVLAALEFMRPWRWHYVDVTFLPITAFLITTVPRTWAFLVFAVLTYSCYLGPLETRWVVRARHLLTVTLASAIVARSAIRSSPRVKDSPS